MRHARAVMKSDAMAAGAAVAWTVRDVRLPTVRETVALIEGGSGEELRSVARFSRLTLCALVDAVAARGVVPVVRVDVDALVGPGWARRVASVRWSPGAWGASGLLLGWADPFILARGLEVLAWQESGDPARLTLDVCADAATPTAGLVLGGGVVSV